MEQSNSHARKGIKTKLLSVAGLLGVAAVAFFWVWLTSPEPTYQGKRLNYWLQGMERQASPEMRNEARKVLSAMGTNAVPFLLKTTCKRDPAIVKWLHRFCVRHSIAGPFWGGRAQEIANAQNGLQWLAARKLVPCSEVIQALKRPGLGEDAARNLGGTLANADPRQFKVILKMAESEDRSIRLNAIRSLDGVRGLLSVDFDLPVTTLLNNTNRRAQKESDREMQHAVEMVMVHWLVPR